MLDTNTFLITQYEPAGPLLRPVDAFAPGFDNAFISEEPLPDGVLVGKLISLGLLIATGIYLALTI